MSIVSMGEHPREYGLPVVPVFCCSRLLMVFFYYQLRVCVRDLDGTKLAGLLPCFVSQR